jgi:hypothetical protein
MKCEHRKELNASSQKSNNSSLPDKPEVPYCVIVVNEFNLLHTSRGKFFN